MVNCSNHTKSMYNTGTILRNYIYIQCTFLLMLDWKSATFNFLWIHFANSSMSWNINVYTCFMYIYFGKIKWNLQSYITNFIQLTPLILNSLILKFRLFWNRNKSPVFASHILCIDFTDIMKSVILKYRLYWSHWSVPKGDN